jgi:hypothetical protein
VNAVLFPSNALARKIPCVLIRVSLSNERGRFAKRAPHIAPSA